MNFNIEFWIIDDYEINLKIKHTESTLEIRNKERDNRS